MPADMLPVGMASCDRIPGVDDSRDCSMSTVLVLAPPLLGGGERPEP